MNRKLSGVAIAALLVGTALLVRRGVRREPEDPVRAAERQMQAFGFEGYPRYMAQHRRCPIRLADVASLLGGASTTDPWGTAYQFRCGGHTLGFPMRSAGADRRFDTEDDLYLDRMFFVFDMQQATLTCSSDTQRCE